MSSDEDLNAIAAPKVMILRMIAGALCMGVLVFIGVAFTVVGDKKPSEQPLLAYLALALAVVTPVMGQVVSQLGLASAAKTADRQGLASQFQTMKIVQYATCEGPALFNVLAFIVDGQVWSVGVAGLMVLGIVLCIPSLGAAVSFIEHAERNRQESFGN